MLQTLSGHSIKDILVIDIETAPLVPNFENLDAEWQELFIQKNRFSIEKINDKNAPINPEINTANINEVFKEKAGILSEFSKVVCIGMGYIHFENENLCLRTHAIFGTEEKKILQEFVNIINKQSAQNKNVVLVGHNILEFDIPFLSRRLLVNRMPIPKAINFSNLKPWEIKNIIDTMQLWKFGDYKNYTSLALLCKLFGVASSKDDMSGKDVQDVFYKEKNYEKIAHYCLKDIVATARLLLKLNLYDEQTILDNNVSTHLLSL